MAREIVPMPAGDTLRIKFAMTEDKMVVPLDGYLITLSVATSPDATTVTTQGSGAYTVITLPRGAVSTAGIYHAEIVADNGATRHTKAFHLRVDDHP